MKKKVKSKKRDKKLWGIEVKALPKYVQTFVDQDYIDGLSKKDKEFLSKFNNEYYANTFERSSDGSAKKGLHDKKNIDRKILYAQTNARQRDVYNASARRGIWNIDEMSTDSPEDAIIEKLDREKEGYIGFDDER